MKALKHDPDALPTGPEPIARARREIAAIAGVCNRQRRCDGCGQRTSERSISIHDGDTGMIDLGMAALRTMRQLLVGASTRNRPRCATGRPRSRRRWLLESWRLARSRKARHGESRAGGRGKNLILLGVDAISPLASLGLEGFDLVAGLLHRAGHKPAHGMALPRHLLHGVDKQMHSGRRMSRNISV
jgi:hypothetical protein